ncbi:MAG: S-methyl-5'-thioinosine phosphorylase [Thermomicrobiales bacterium]
MQRFGIIGGTGVEMPGEGFVESKVATPFGEARVFLGEGDYADCVFLSRHGARHDIPPHKVNYRANIFALHKLGVRDVLASFAVGSISEDIAPGAAVAIDQIIDFTHGREQTFFDGGEHGLYHVPFTEPVCSSLREQMISLAPSFQLDIRPSGTYVCFNGPRFETAAEIRMFGLMGAEVVGMTAMPEAALARELGLHYAGVAVSVNWAAGVRGPLVLDMGALDGIRGRLLPLFLKTLRTPRGQSCTCDESEGDHSVIGARPTWDE